MFERGRPRRSNLANQTSTRGHWLTLFQGWSPRRNSSGLPENQQRSSRFTPPHFFIHLVFRLTPGGDAHPSVWFPLRCPYLVAASKTGNQTRLDHKRTRNTQRSEKLKPTLKIRKRHNDLNHDKTEYHEACAGKHTRGQPSVGASRGPIGSHT